MGLLWSLVFEQPDTRKAEDQKLAARPEKGIDEQASIFSIVYN